MTTYWVEDAVPPGLLHPGFFGEMQAPQGLAQGQAPGSPGQEVSPGTPRQQALLQAQSHGGSRAQIVAEGAAAPAAMGSGQATPRSPLQEGSAAGAAFDAAVAAEPAQSPAGSSLAGHPLPPGSGGATPRGASPALPPLPQPHSYGGRGSGSGAVLPGVALELMPDQPGAASPGSGQGRAGVARSPSGLGLVRKLSGMAAAAGAALLPSPHGGAAAGSEEGAGGAAIAQHRISPEGSEPPTGQHSNPSSRPPSVPLPGYPEIDGGHTQSAGQVLGVPHSAGQSPGATAGTFVPSAAQNLLTTTGSQQQLQLQGRGSSTNLISITGSHASITHAHASTGSNTLVEEGGPHGHDMYGLPLAPVSLATTSTAVPAPTSQGHRPSLIAQAGGALGALLGGGGGKGGAGAGGSQGGEKEKEKEKDSTPFWMAGHHHRGGGMHGGMGRRGEHRRFIRQAGEQGDCAWGGCCACAVLLRTAWTVEARNTEAQAQMLHLSRSGLHPLRCLLAPCPQARAASVRSTPTPATPARWGRCCPQQAAPP